MVVTKDDIDALKDWIDVTIDEKLDRKLDEKLKYLPTKDEFYTETAKILKKMEDVEGSMTILNDRSSKHSDRIEKLEKIHPKYSHSLVV